MNLKLDENLPNEVGTVLKRLGHDIHTVQEEDLAGAFDRVIWERAQSESRFFLTQDMDFSDLREFVPGTHSGILLVRLHAPSWKRLVARLEEVFRTEDVTSWPGCFVVATDSKIRIVRRYPN